MVKVLGENFLALSLLEVFALFLVFTTYMYFSKFRYSKIYYIGIISSILGLYFSNNRAAFLLIIFIGLLILFLKIKYTNYSLNAG